MNIDELSLEELAKIQKDINARVIILKNQIYNDKTIPLINQFIAEISRLYPDLHIAYEYNLKEDTCQIWHNDSHLEFEDVEFAMIAGIALRKFFYDNNVDNVYFSYDYEKSQELNGVTK